MYIQKWISRTETQAALAKIDPAYKDSGAGRKAVKVVFIMHWNDSWEIHDNNVGACEYLFGTGVFLFLIKHWK